jgi:hypothetical protein
MRLARFSALCFLLLLCVFLPLHAKSKKLTVTGKLTRTMAIGAETSGWLIELNPAITLDGKQLTSLEVQSSDTQKLESLNGQWVQAKGTLSSISGVETGARTILQVSSVKGIKQPQGQKSWQQLISRPPASFWRRNSSSLTCDGFAFLSTAQV